MFVKIEWKALVDASRAMGYTDLPDQTEPSMLDSNKFLINSSHRGGDYVRVGLAASSSLPERGHFEQAGSFRIGR
ncbi:hypothetical protein L1049_002749 [Liquidambar formosana]|uniref:Uncharacterized protein n=1 Tax=Liquidambar formosana TaxID=63359 RepID=A0AAP0NGN2_LIQFO